MAERRIGDFTLDLERPSLRKEKQEVYLTAQSYRLLKRLSDPPRKTLSQAELIAALWPEFRYDRASETAREAYENRLRTAVNSLRKQLEPDAKSPRLYIGTVSSFGYRIEDSVLVEEIQDQPAAVEVASALPKASLDELSSKDPPAAPPVPAESTRAPDQDAGQRPARRRGRSWLWGVLAVGALAVLFLVAYSLRPRKESLPLVLVLPVANHTKDAVNDSMAEGLTDELITQLGVLGKGKLTVLPRSTSILFRNKGFVLSELKKQVNADYVLESFIRDDMVGLKLDINFFRTEDGARLFGQSYPTDSKSMRGDVASMLAAQVVLALQGLPPAALTPRPYSSPHQGADEAFDRGLNQMAADRPAAAVAEFLNVIRLDPDYGDVYTDLALAYYQWAQQEENGWKQAVEKGDAAIEEALFRAPESTKARAVRGLSRWFYHWNWVEAERDFTVAIEQDDGNADAHRWYGLALATSGKSAEAEEQMERAMRTRPEPPVDLLLDYGWVQYLSGHPNEAALTLERVLRVRPGSVPSNLRLWSVYSLLGRYAEALQRLCVATSCASSKNGWMSVPLSDAQGYAAALREWSRTAKPSVALNALTRSEIAVYSLDDQGAMRKLTDGCRRQDGSLVYALADPALAKLKPGTRMQRDKPGFCNGRL